VKAAWWNTRLAELGLAGGPLRSSEAADDPAQTVTIRRRDLFALAEPVAEGRATDEDVLRLLWHVLAWGSGSARRQNAARMASFVDQSAVELLRKAGEAAGDPATAYRMLIRVGGGVIPRFGPSFFTKYLYFAGAGRPDHPCVILDARVAASLHRYGWTTLPPRWRNWYTDTYASYCDLLGRWADEASNALNRPVARDELELWLFDPRR
jgi:hypothetical protein